MSAAAGRGVHRRWIALAPVALWTSIASLHAASRAPAELEITDVAFLRAGQSDNAEWIREEPRAVWPPEERERRYRFSFDAARAGGDFGAIYLPTVTMNAAVHLNGARLGDGGRFESPLPRNTNRPLLFQFPRSQLQSGENVVDVRVVTEPPGRGSLGPVFV
ncbi:MAG: hypothetical protein ACREQJ_15905, partial [Candidatus Binatia bacterium]